MAAGELDINIEQGALFELPLTYKIDTMVVPLVTDGWSAHMQIRRSKGAKTSTLDFRSTGSPTPGTTGCHIILADAAPNIILKANGPATSLLDFEAGVYDLFLFPPTAPDEPDKVLKGTVTVDLSVTREAS